LVSVATDLTVDGLQVTGIAGDNIAGTVFMQSPAELAERNVDLAAEQPYLQDMNDGVVVMTNSVFVDTGTAEYTIQTEDQIWEPAAIIVSDDEVGGSGTVDVTDTSATGEGNNQINTYGSPTVTTTNAPPVNYPEGTAAIHVRVTSNDVQAGGDPGQQPLGGVTGKVFEKFCSDNYPDPVDVNANCFVKRSCITDAVTGECTLQGLPAGDFFVLAESMTYAGKYPSHVVGGLQDDQTKFARLAFLNAPDGKTSPGRTKVQTGSELWIYEPAYVVWDGTEEYYPFVFESPDMSWTVDVCIDAPEGYEPVDGVECLQTIIAGESKSILFQLVEVGSVPGPVGVDFDMTSPSGKKYKVASQVGMRLSNHLSKAKGVAIDKNGRLLSKGKGQGVGLTGGAVTEGLSGSSVFAFVLLVLVALAAATLLYMRKTQKP
jgi:hypothetical protein